MQATLSGVSLPEGITVISLTHNNKAVTIKGGLNSNTSDSSSVTNPVTFTSPAYFGGVPDDVKTPDGVTRRSLRACIGSIRSGKLDDKVLRKEANYTKGSNGYNRNQCPLQTIGCATLDGLGHVLMEDFSVLGVMNSYVSIYPTADTGVVLYDGSETV